MGCRRRHREGRHWERDRIITYISFTEDHVYYAADNDEGVKGIPGITKIALHTAAEEGANGGD